MNPTATQAWQQLTELATQLRATHLSDLTRDAARCAGMQFECAGCHFDFSKQWATSAIVERLTELATEVAVPARRDAMLRGDKINTSEDRAVLHTALRDGSAAAQPIRQLVTQELERLRVLAEQLRSARWLGYTGKPIRDVVHIGIGGSHLGPELVVRALEQQGSSQLRIHFVANIDAHDLTTVLAKLDPATTLFVVVSKSWGTLETQVNAATARSWFLERTCSLEGISRHFVAVTSNVKAAQAFGLDAANLFPLEDWVGGRFSLWSAVGLPILLHLGEAGHDEFLAGAQTMDTHFANAPVASNLPLLGALFAIWNYNFLGAATQAVLAYDERLALLPEYLQQLEMESNGKSVTLDSEPVEYHTMPVLWGGVGTRGQHAYHQQLHQGTRAYAADFIAVAQDDYDLVAHHAWLNANALAQSQAMATGYSAEHAHRNVPGNHPSTTVILDELAPRQLGALLAYYEHKVFCSGVIWNINSFDQWGVELGKRLALPIHEQLVNLERSANSDAATEQLIVRLKSRPT